MNFIKNLIPILIVTYVFAFFGGLILFDISSNYYVAATAIAVVIDILVTAFVSQEERIDQLEQRLEALERKDDQ